MAQTLAGRTNRALHVRRTPGSRGTRYIPVVERLEDRLPPGSAIDWLLFAFLSESFHRGGTGHNNAIVEFDVVSPRRPANTVLPATRESTFSPWSSSEPNPAEVPVQSSVPPRNNDGLPLAAPAFALDAGLFDLGEVLASVSPGPRASTHAAESGPYTAGFGSGSRPAFVAAAGAEFSETVLPQIVSGQGTPATWNSTDLAELLALTGQKAMVPIPERLGEHGWRPPATRADGAVRFAVIGDYGSVGYPEYWVSEMVKSWGVDFVVTTGDNNYPDGAAWTIVPNIGWFYCDYIHNPTAPFFQRCDSGLKENRFFPSLGNHDWDTTSGGLPRPYLDYFDLPGNERYYDFVQGPVHFFVIDSDPAEPDGTSSTSVQGRWLQEQMAASESPWKVVVMHHPPYSSGERHGSTVRMQWPYQEWGASVVLAGHDHAYERIVRNGFPYFVNGVGGNWGLYPFGPPIEGSEMRYNFNWGAQYVEATADSLHFYFVNIVGELLDFYAL